MGNAHLTKIFFASEILSLSQSQTKVANKILHCLAFGSAMGWLIDPHEKAVLVYLPQQQTQIYEMSSQLLPLPEFVTDCSLSVPDIFALLLD